MMPLKKTQHEDSATTHPTHPHYSNPRIPFPFCHTKRNMCGIIGLFTKEELGIHVAGELNTALTMLQHRGQGSLSPPFSFSDACGITTCDGQQVRTVKDNGLVSE